MQNKIVLRTVVTLAVLAPFIVFQGVPALAPAWLTAKLLGVPATAWLGAGGFIAFVGLIWIFAREAKS